MDSTSFKSGFVNLVGNPNVGKSTLMNAFLGTKLSITSPKVQTTRHRILGLLTENNYQIVFSDTPGIVKPKYELQRYMLNYAFSALEDADILLYLTDIEDRDRYDQEFIDKLNQINTPKLLIINKIDIHSAEEIATAEQVWKKRFKDDVEIWKVSALTGENINTLKQRLLELLPYNPPYFPEDELSDRTERFFISEIIREKIFFNYYQEIPYSTDVQIDAFEEKDNVIVIRATIYAIRDSQKNIIIGHNGSGIKKIGMEARKDIEDFLDHRVFLDLHVKVRKNWRDDKNWLSRLGYTN